MQAGTSRATLAAAAAAAFAGGAVMSLQSRINGELSTGFAAPLDAAMWSFGSGAVLLSLLLLAAPGVRAAVRDLPDALRDGRLSWWQCLGGLGGGAFVVAQTYAVPLAGVAIFTIAVVGGQTGNALLVDKLGLGPAGKAPVTPARAASAALAFVGVVVAVSARGGGGGQSVVVPALIAAFVGALMTVQQATNGRVGAETGSAMATTWLNFTVGTCFLVLAGLVQAVTGSLRGPATLHVPWWAWLGGLCGIAFIFMAAVVVRSLGVLLFTLVMLTGQLSAAVALDLLTPATRSHIGVQVVLGILVTLVAAGAAGVTSRRAAQRQEPQRSLA
jgi:bacterial/archaeal transporter family-2 protein